MKRKRKLELNPQRSRILEIGSSAKAPKARRAVGLIATLPTAKADTSLAEDQMERSGRNTQPAALLRAHVRREAKVNLGAKKLKRNQNQEEKRSETYK